MNPIGIFWNSEERRLSSLWRLLGHFVLMAFCLGMTMSVAALFSASRVNGSTIRLGSIAGAIAITCGIVGSVWLAGRILDRRKFSNFGVKLNLDWFGDLGFGLLLGAFLMTVVFVVELACGWITVTSIFSGASTGELLSRLAAAAVLFIGVGIHEEMMSRGYHLKNLAEGLSPIGARLAVVLSVLASSAVFGLMHASNPNSTAVSTINLILAGIFLAAGYIYTGQLGISIGLHITWNFFQGPVFGFPVSGGTFGPSIFGIEQGGSDVVTGGAFGPEAGLVGLGAMLLGTLLILAYVRCRNGSVRLQESLTKPDLLSDTQ